MMRKALLALALGDGVASFRADTSSEESIHAARGESCDYSARNRRE